MSARVQAAIAPSARDAPFCTSPGFLPVGAAWMERFRSRFNATSARVAGGTKHSRHEKTDTHSQRNPRASAARDRLPHQYSAEKASRSLNACGSLPCVPGQRRVGGILPPARWNTRAGALSEAKGTSVKLRRSKPGGMKTRSEVVATASPLLLDAAGQVAALIDGILEKSTT